MEGVGLGDYKYHVIVDREYSIASVWLLTEG